MEPPLQEVLCCDGPAFWTTEPPLKCFTDTIWLPDGELLLQLCDALAAVPVDALGFEVPDDMLPVFKKSLLKFVSKTFARLGKKMPAVRAIELKPAIASGSITFRSGERERRRLLSAARCLKIRDRR
jgi:hypothetical protein